MVFRQEVHQYDIGTELRFTVKDKTTNAVVDLSGATVLKVIFRKPDGSASQKDVTYVSDGTDGQVHFISPGATQWDQIGEWDAQLNLAIPGWSGRSSVVTFRVFPALATS